MFISIQLNMFKKTTETNEAISNMTTDLTDGCQIPQIVCALTDIIFVTFHMEVHRSCGVWRAAADGHESCARAGQQ